LRSANTLSTGKSHQIKPHFRIVPEVGNRRHIGSSIVEARHPMLVGDADPIFPAYPATLGSIEELGHYCAFGERPFIFIERLHIDEARATVANRDRKSTRLNSSHVAISYAVFCLKKKK